MIGACPRKDRTMDDERSIKWAGIGPGYLSQKKTGVLGGELVRNQRPIWWE